MDVEKVFDALDDPIVRRIDGEMLDIGSRHRGCCVGHLPFVAHASVHRLRPEAAKAPKYRP